MNKNNSWNGRNIVHRKGLIGEVAVYNANTPEGNSLYNKATDAWIINVGVTLASLVIVGGFLFF